MGALDRRSAGLLLHPTSLPGPGPQGDLGPDSRRFVDFLAASGFGVWQVLPLNPPHNDGSPYQAQSAHAGDPRLISLQLLSEQGWLAPEEPGGRRRAKPAPVCCIWPGSSSSVALALSSGMHSRHLRSAMGIG
ncbi:4-alpha-glucanotransferase [Acidihalobacter sp.]|uniref:4-alpha-glucanotransferase n=1 Tax=Acidihalobacter sp. TaxID=1872108 RepID=UPI00307E594B